MKKIYGTFGVEMRAYGQKLIKFCTHTQTDRHVNLSSIDYRNDNALIIYILKQFRWNTVAMSHTKVLKYTCVIT